ncbi:MAG: putative nucleotidyltransferase, partial [Ulvibacter sp.]
KIKKEIIAIVMKFGLKEDNIEKINKILSKYKNIDEARLYGSRAIGNYREGSDIDLTLKGNLDLQNLQRIVTDLDDLLLPYKFDISIFSDINNDNLIDHIKRIGVIFYKK